MKNLSQKSSESGRVGNGSKKEYTNYSLECWIFFNTYKRWKIHGSYGEQSTHSMQSKIVGVIVDGVHHQTPT